MNKEEKIRRIRLLQEDTKRKRSTRITRLYEAMYPWQKSFNKNTSSFEACMLMAGNQVGKCVTKQTLIDLANGSQKTAGELYEAGEPFEVFSWDEKNKKMALATAVLPIKKPPEACVRLFLENGRWFECAVGHRVLTSPGYSSVLSILESLPCLPQTSSGLFPSTHALDGHRYTGTSQDYQDGYFACCRHDDEQPHPWSDSGLSFLPLLGDALQRAAVSFDLDGLASIYTSIRLQVRAHLSSLGVYRPNVAPLVEFLAPFACTSSGQRSGYNGNIPRIVLESILHPQSDGEAQSYQSSSLLEPNMCGNQIIAYQPIGCHDVYDFHVPGYENYITAGVVHHNSRTGCIIDAFHLLGDYPDDWEGHKFDSPPLVWCLGYSGEKTRDLLQKKIVGDLDTSVKKMTGGYVPQERILGYKGMPGTTGAVREVTVEHKSGGSSVIQFWSYSQGQHALMGDVVDWYHIDEEPEDHEIYPQVLTRTINGDRGRGGRGILTFTPENGKTELVCQFMDDIEEGMYIQRATWDECPHIAPEQQTKMLAKYPPYQRDMRKNGDPLMGEGLVYAYPGDKISCKRFEIPDHWWLINGMDFGWKHPQAHIQLAIDPETEAVYVTHAWKGSEVQPHDAWDIVKPWCEKVPTAWPHDGSQHKIQGENKDAMTNRELYEEKGWYMLSDHAHWPEGDMGVDFGLMEINKLMSQGKFLIFDDLEEVFAEQREYHTKLLANGLSRIVKIKDDLLDAIRYAFMMARFAEQKYMIYNPPAEDDFSETRTTSAMGY